MRDYDYAQPGMYFFTICSYRPQLLFGDVINGEMNLNELGEIVFDEWRKSATIRCELELDEFIVMRGLADGMDFYRDEKNKDAVIKYLGEFYKSNNTDELEETRRVYTQVSPGLPVVTVKSMENMPAFKKALAADRSALIEVQTDYEYVTPTTTLSELAGKKLAGD